MAIILNDNLKINVGKPIDSKYLNGLIPYTSISDVNTTIPIGERYVGLTVNVANVEYWYELGVTDGNLIIKSAGGSGSGERIEKTFTQVNHGFSFGDIVTYSGGTFIKAIADGIQNGEVIGFVSQVLDLDNFIMIFSGYVDGISGLTLNPSTTYYLSTTIAGALDGSDTVVLNTISKPILVTFDTDSALIFQYRGFFIDSGTTGGGSTSGITGIENIGNGEALYSPPLVSTISGQTAEFRSLVGSGNTTVSTSGDTIIIDSSGGNKEIFTTTLSNINIPTTSTDKVYVASGTTGYTLPSIPTIGNEIIFIDGIGNANTINITVNGNGKNILNDTTGTINTNYGSFTIIYNGVFWSVTSHVP